MVSFIAKTQLFGGNRMFIDTREAFTLVKKYFKDFEL
jgi:hypothetical protein